MAGPLKRFERKNGRLLIESARFWIPDIPCEHLSSRGGTRTPDPVINSHLLYHLSYSGIAIKITQKNPLNQPEDPEQSRVFPIHFSDAELAKS